MPNAPAQRDYHRRPTRPDRPFVWAGDDVRNLPPEVLDADCGTHCYDDCLKRGPITVNGKPAAQRLAFDFHSNDVQLSPLNGTQVLTWDATDELWITDDHLVDCVDGDGVLNLKFRLRPVSYPWSAEDFEPWGMLLELGNFPGGTAGTCPHWYVSFLQYWKNVYRFDPLCPNLFRPVNKSPVAGYDLTQSCTLCIEPVILMQEIGCPPFNAKLTPIWLNLVFDQGVGSGDCYQQALLRYCPHASEPDAADVYDACPCCFFFRSGDGDGNSDLYEVGDNDCSWVECASHPGRDFTWLMMVTDNSHSGIPDPPAGQLLITFDGSRSCSVDLFTNLLYGYIDPDQPWPDEIPIFSGPNSVPGSTGCGGESYGTDHERVATLYPA